MLKKILQSTAFTLLFLGFMVSGVYASAKMEVALGEEVVLELEDLVSASGQVKWIVYKDGESLSVQDAPRLRYAFLQQGEYEVIAEVEDRNNQVRSTTIFVLAGNRFSVVGDGESEGGGLSGGSAGPIELVYQTLPPQDAAGNVRLLGDGRFAVDIQAIDPRILEYRVDYNVFRDGDDGDGITSNDIDNANERCFLLGGICQTTYTLGEAEKVTAQITLVSRSGEKIQDQINILFDDPPLRSGDLVAQLEILPIPRQNNGIVSLYKDTHSVGFYSKNSLGEIQEYRIDKNILFDSDGDGNPSNDIDNLSHDSFRSGDVWVTDYEKTDEQIIASLTIVGPGGRGSRVERGIVFTDPPTVEVTGGNSSDNAIQLKADKPFALLGNPVNFSVENLSRDLEDYLFEWDFDGDEIIDKEVEGDNIVSHIYETPGIFNSMVKVTDSDGNTGTFSLDFLVQEPEGTKADFEFTVQGGTVTFVNLSSASVQLGDKNLNYTWNFGETDEASYEAQKDQIGVQNPVYNYTQPGTYQVSLTVVDANQIKDTKTVEVMVEEVIGAQGSTDDASPDEGGGSGSLIITILKVLLYIVLVLVILIFLFLVGLVAFTKVQHPDLSFGETIDEVRLKLLSWMGVGDMVDSKTDSASADAQEVEAELLKDVPQSSEPQVQESSAKDQVNSSSDQLATSQPTPEPIRLDEKPIEKPKDDSDDIEASHPGTGPMPDWLKGGANTSSTDESNVIDGEIDEDDEEEDFEDDDSDTDYDEDTEEDQTVKDSEAKTNEKTDQVESSAEEKKISAEPTPEKIPPTPTKPATPPDVAESDKDTPASSGSGSIGSQDGPVPDWLKGK